MAAKIDIAYIVKRLKDFKRGLIDFQNLLEGIYIDMDIRHGPKDKQEAIKDHLGILKSDLQDGNIKDSELIGLAKEIYYMEFLPKENKMKRLTIEQKSKVKKFIKKLQFNALSESVEYEFVIYAVGVSGNEQFPSGGDMYKLKASDFNQAWLRFQIKVNDLDLNDKDDVKYYLKMLKDAAKYNNRLAIAPDDIEAFILSKGPMTKKEAKDIILQEFGEDEDDENDYQWLY